MTSASRRERTVSPTTENTVKYAVLPSARQNCPSASRRAKLLSPTNTGARFRLASKKLR
jgi:hypothetical protein